MSSNKTKRRIRWGEWAGCIVILFSLTYCGSKKGGTQVQSGPPSTPPFAHLTLSALDGSGAFGTIPIHFPVTHHFQISNDGTLSLSAITCTLPIPSGYTQSPYAIVNASCPTSLDPGQSFSFTIDFTPTIAGADASGDFDVAYSSNGAQTHVKMALSGAGSSAALLVLGPNPLDFGQIVPNTTSPTVIAQVTYYGQSSAVVQSASSPGGDFSYVGGSYPGTGGTCGTTISANCTLALEFSPTAMGASQGTLTISYTDGAGDTLDASLPLTGNGATEAVLAVSPSGTIAFGNTTSGQTSSLTYTLSNSGGANASSVVISLGSQSPSNAFSIAGTCPSTSFTLSGGSSCTLVLQFEPMSTGNYSASLNMSYNNGSGLQLLSTAITGTGL